MEKLPREASDQKPLPFTLLRDRGNAVAAKYHLAFTLPDDLKAVYLKIGVDLPKANGDDSWTLPMPARFVIDAGGVIRQSDIDPDYTVRSEPERTLDVLRALGR